MLITMEVDGKGKRKRAKEVHSDFSIHVDPLYMKKEEESGKWMRSFEGDKHDQPKCHDTRLSR